MAIDLDFQDTATVTWNVNRGVNPNVVTADAAGGSAPTPEQIFDALCDPTCYFFFEDFYKSGNGAFSGLQQWTFAQTGATAVTSSVTAGFTELADGQHLGIQKTAILTTNNFCNWYHGGFQRCDWLGKLSTKVWRFFGSFKTDLVTQLNIEYGLGDQTTNLGTNFWQDGFYFMLNTATSPNWIARSINGGVATDVVTSVPAVAATWNRFDIASDGAGNITYYIDNVLVATITTNLAVSLSLNLGYGFKTLDANPKSQFADYVGFKLTGLTRL